MLGHQGALPGKPSQQQYRLGLRPGMVYPTPAPSHLTCSGTQEPPSLDSGDGGWWDGVQADSLLGALAKLALSGVQREGRS